MSYTCNSEGLQIFLCLINSTIMRPLKSLHYCHSEGVKRPKNVASGLRTRRLLCASDAEIGRYTLRMTILLGDFFRTLIIWETV